MKKFAGIVFLMAGAAGMYYLGRQNGYTAGVTECHNRVKAIVGDMK